MSYIMRHLRGGHGGFSLIELIVAVALTGMIGGVVATGIAQLHRASEKAQNHTQVSTELQNVSYWIQVDAKMSQQVTPDGGGTGFPLTLDWVDFDNVAYQVVYDVSGREMIRYYSTNGGTPTEYILSECIVSGTGATTCEFTDNMLYFRLTGSAGGGKYAATEAREFRVAPRATQ